MRWLLSYFVLKTFNLCVTRLYDHRMMDDERFLELVFRLKKERRVLQNVWELYNLYRGIIQTTRVPGDIVELGVYKGGSAKLICETKGKRNLHLFDTFKGLAETEEDDVLGKGSFSDITVDGVKEYLRDYKNVFYYEGLFHETVEGIKDRKFSFLHLDVDVYRSTLDALHFFYPRMNMAGMILSHDYNSKSCPGVKKAFDEYFRDKSEPIIELSGSTQCLITKLHG